MLEGHGTAPPDLDLSAINGKPSALPLLSLVGGCPSRLPKEAPLTFKMLSLALDKSMVRKTPQLEKTMSKKTESTSFSASQKKSPVSVRNEREATQSEKADTSSCPIQVPLEALRLYD